MSDSLQSVMSSLEEKGARLQQALQESRVADSRLEQVRLSRLLVDLLSFGDMIGRLVVGRADWSS